MWPGVQSDIASGRVPGHNNTASADITLPDTVNNVLMIRIVSADIL